MKICDSEVRTIRIMRSANPRIMTLSFLADLYQTSIANVFLITTGKTHKEAGGPITPAKAPATEVEIVAIRCRRADGIPYKQLAHEFGKSEVALRSICSGKSYPQYGGPLTGSKK